MKRKRQALEVKYRNAAGIDVGSREHYVCAPVDAEYTETRVFGPYTCDLEALADWLVECGVTSAAVESTGIYWLQIFEVLEDKGIEVCLVNGQDVKALPGRKSDVQDSQWLQQLHEAGLLRKSFLPSGQWKPLRDLWRKRCDLVEQRARTILKVQHALRLLNLRLTEVVTDIMGSTGRKIINMVLAGEQDPATLASARHPNCKKKEDEIARALYGNWRNEHLVTLSLEMDMLDFIEKQIVRLDAEIEKFLDQLPSHPDTPDGEPTQRPKHPNSTNYDASGEMFRITGVDFCAIPGMGSNNLQTILAEVGNDPSKFGKSKAFSSWLSLCPNQKITGGKTLSTQTRRSSNRAANAFRMAAECNTRSDNPLGIYYRKMRARMGPAQALTALAHRIARIFYFMWSNRSPYDPEHVAKQDLLAEQRRVSYLRKRAKKAGFELVPINIAP